MSTLSGRRRPNYLKRDGQVRRHKPDYMLLLIAAILLACGLVVVYAISPGISEVKGVSEEYYVSKQLIAVVMGITAFTITSFMPVGWWQRLEKPLIITAILAAIAVRLFGEEVNGALRWVQIGGISFQAAELIKLALVVWLAGFLTDRLKKGQIADFDVTLKPLLIVLIGIAIVVAYLQTDLGSTAVMIAIMAAMSFVAGLPMRRILLIGGVILLVGTIAVSTTAYRRQRLTTFLHPTSDCQNTGYQACQALIAIGSGGMFGRGLGHSVQAYGYLPEAANDSIFAILAEKFGFLGVSIIIGLFVGLFGRLKRIIDRTPDLYSRLLVTGVLAWLSTQAIINIGAMVGLLPLKGITLPFISYGGTSLLFVSVALGMAFQISRYSAYSKLVNEKQEGGNRRGNDNRADGGGIRRTPYPRLERRS